MEVIYCPHEVLYLCTLLLRAWRAYGWPSLPPSIEEDGKYVETLESGERKELAPAKLTLNDCLACSGCVTTAETMLIQAQSAAEFFANLKKPEGRTFVVSVSPQVRRLSARCTQSCANLRRRDMT